MKIILEMPDFDDDATAEAFVAALRSDLGDQARIVGVIHEELLTVKTVQIIKLDPSLPCARWKGALYCGNPASLATVEGSLGGEVLIAPLCRSCALGGMPFDDPRIKQPPTA